MRARLPFERQLGEAMKWLRGRTAELEAEVHRLGTAESQQGAATRQAEQARRELEQAKRKLADVYESETWRTGEVLLRLFRVVARLLRRRSG